MYKKGVAFHFGKLPQRIRECIEELFEEKVIDYIFCTSTLLEGVNLPAQNIFILNNTIGTRKFTDIDFWNLAGRAGRLSKELSGNIICVRLDSSKWKTKEDDIKIIREKVIHDVSPTILKGEENFYKNIENSLTGKPFTRAKPTQSQIETWNHYANIVYYQEIAKADSLLKSNFMKKNHKTAKKVLSTIEKNNQIPDYILEQSTSIKPIYQNNIWKSLQDTESAFSDEITYASCYEMLEKMYKIYHWDSEEAIGRNPLIRNKEQLKYYTHLMYDWISSKPLNMIIINMISYHKRVGYIWHGYEKVYFDSKNKEHINWVINNLISDIDSRLQYRIKNYFSNYFLLVSNKNGIEVAGKDWSQYLEYGTTDKTIIDLQNIGLSRHVAMIIKENYEDVLVYDDQELANIDFKMLFQIIDKQKFKHEYNELIAMFED